MKVKPSTPRPVKLSDCMINTFHFESLPDSESMLLFDLNIPDAPLPEDILEHYRDEVQEYRNRGCGECGAPISESDYYVIGVTTGPINQIRLLKLSSEQIEETIADQQDKWDKYSGMTFQEALDQVSDLQEYRNVLFGTPKAVYYNAETGEIV